MLTLYIIPVHLHVAGGCNPSSCKEWPYLFYIINVMGGDVVAMQETKASATMVLTTVYPKKYAHGYCFAVICCGYTLTDFPKSIRLTWLALWQSNDCPSASKATLMNMYKYSMWIINERLHNHNKANHNKIVCIFLGIYYMLNRNNSVPSH